MCFVVHHNQSHTHVNAFHNIPTIHYNYTAPFSKDCSPSHEPLTFVCSHVQQMEFSNISPMSSMHGWGNLWPNCIPSYLPKLPPFMPCKIEVLLWVFFHNARLQWWVNDKKLSKLNMNNFPLFRCVLFEIANKHIQMWVCHFSHLLLLICTTTNNLPGFIYGDFHKCGLPKCHNML